MDVVAMSWEITRATKRSRELYCMHSIHEALPLSLCVVSIAVPYEHKKRNILRISE